MAKTTTLSLLNRSTVD